MTLNERVAQYLAACPPAVSGQNGSGQTFFVACQLTNGFGLSESEALSYMQLYNQRCSPPWSEKEIEHKVQDAAASNKHEKPRGHLIGNGTDGKFHKNDLVYKRPSASSHPPNSPGNNGKQPHHIVNPTLTSDVPLPMTTPTSAFLMAAFKPDEGVSISRVAVDNDGKGFPLDPNQVIPRDELISKLDAVGGDPNALFACELGAWVRVNPMIPAGTCDKDVTAHRHVLVEFDEGDMRQQWQSILQSGVPCTAILTSGKRSVHAWIRVDATDAKQFSERVQEVYDYFIPLGADEKNKNASRYSRLPGMKRGDKMQELLAVNIGARTFEQWQIDKAAAGIGKHITIAELLSFVPGSDSNSVLGNRFLCLGYACVIVGPTGIGKSSLALQAAIHWALNGDVCGISPTFKPLKSLFIQAENDVGDMAEMLQGILLGTGLISERHPENNAIIAKTLEENLIIVRDQSHTGIEFAAAVRKLIDKHKPDLVWIDPLLSFYGDDINDQKACGTFTRHYLNPISEATGVIWMILHHTGKPMKDAKSVTKNWTAADFAYQGIGSSELSNWARAIISIVRLSDNTFRIALAKRGLRAGAKTISGEPTINIYMAHGDNHICWKQIENPEENPEENSRDGGRPSVIDKIAASNLFSFLSSCKPEGEGLNEISNRLEIFLATTKIDISISTSKRVIPLLVANGKLTKNPSLLYVKGPNS